MIVVHDDGSYMEYAQKAVENFAAFGAERRFMLVDEASKNLTKIERVLDVGCSAGQEMLPFAEKTTAHCYGVDIAPEVGAVGEKVFTEAGFAGRAFFTRSQGESLPFADASFDVVICRVALPYMDNRQTLAEIARVLKTGGRFFLKIHAPRFYFGMLRRRASSFNPKQLAYPLICLSGGAWHSLTGNQPRGRFWRGKEIYQTKNYLKKELAKNNLRIEKELPDTNAETPSFLIVKR